MKDDALKIIEQIQKEDDIFAKARLLKFLRHEKEVPAKEIAEALSLKPAYLSHLLRLNRLPEIIIDGYYSKLVSMSHLFIIARLKESMQMTELYEKILTENLTNQQTDQWVREKLYSVKSIGERLTEEQITNYRKKIVANSSQSLQVIQTRIKGKIILEIKGNLRESTAKLNEWLGRLSS